MLSLQTFGNSACAENLAKILNELNDERVTTNVSRFLVSNNIIIKQLKDIKDKKSREVLVSLYRKSLYETPIVVPEKVKTHAINVLVAKIRDSIYRGE